MPDIKSQAEKDSLYQVYKKQHPPQSVATTTPKSINPVALPSCFEPFDNTGGNGWNVLDRNDDNSFGPVTLGWNFSLFGTIYNSVYINNNGNITFDGSLRQFTPDGFPIYIPMIAPFWTDVDTRDINSGGVWYKVYSDRLVIVWDKVGYYNQNSDKRNTFQLIIKANTSPTFTGNDVIFAYGDMQWTTGDVSGGIYGFGGSAATVGANQGDGINFIQTGRFNLDGNQAPNTPSAGSPGGIDWLDGKCFGYQVRGAVSNIPPAVAGLPANNQLAVNIGQSRTLTMQFSGPEPSQRVTVTPALNGLCNVTATVTNNNTPNPIVTMVVRGSTCNQGTNLVQLTAVDSGTPSLSQTFTLAVVTNQGNINPYLQYTSGTTIRFNQPAGTATQTLTVVGTGFTPNSIATLKATTSSGQARTFSVNVNSSGKFSYGVVVDNSFVSGQYMLNGQDALGVNVPIPLTFTVIPPATDNSNVLVINSISTAQTTSWKVFWSDVMWSNPASYLTQLANRAYRYKIEYGLANSSGQVSSWTTAGYFPASGTGFALLNSTQQFSFSFTPAQANASGTYAVRVTDELLNTRKTEKQFQYSPALLNDISFVWDYPNRNLTNVVEGAAADSVGRFMIKVSPSSTLVNAIEVALEDVGGSATESRLLGKLMKATAINVVSSEANSAVATSAFNNQPVNGSYWFWYVAPDDFARSTADYDKAERLVTLRVRYYNSVGNLLSEATKPIKIVRPALMLVHGLGGDESTWDKFSHDGGILFKDDPRFKVRNVVALYGNRSFNDNSSALLGYDLFKYRYSFKSTLDQLRIQGFACSRVDYVAHSMGGSMLRNTVHAYKYQFYSEELTYSKGYVHKFITLDTPHQGSPLGDIVTEFAEYMDTDGFLLSKFSGVPDWKTFFYQSGNKVIQSTAILPIMGGGYTIVTTPKTVPVYKVSGAVYDLGIKKGVRFSAATLNNHQIVGDYVRQFGDKPGLAFLRAQNYLNPDLAEDIDNNPFSIFSFKLSDIELGGLGMPSLSRFLGDAAINKFASCNCQPLLKEIQNLAYLRNTFTHQFINWQSKRVYPAGGDQFFQNSDMIVSVESQSAGRIKTGSLVETFDKPTLTVLYDVNHNFKPDKVCWSKDAGNKVFELLNRPVNDPLFAKTLPASPIISSSYACSDDCPTPKANNKALVASTKTIKIIQPVTGASYSALSAFPVSVSITNLTNLYYVQTDFQGYRAVDTTHSQQINYVFQADPALLGWQPLISKATYKLADGTFTSSSDTAWVNITPGVPLVSIESNQLLYEMATGDRQYLNVIAHFTTFDSPIPFTETSMSVTVGNPNIVRFDGTTGQFVARSAGQTSVTLVYQGKTTEILFNVNCTNLSATLTGSQTISAGQVATLTAELSGGDSYTLTLNNGQVFRNITDTPFSITVSPTSTTSYFLASISAACGTGTVSGTAVVTVQNSNTCTAPTSLTETEMTPSSIRLNWLAVSGATSYTLQYRETGTTSWTTASVGATVTGWTIAALLGKTYEWQIRTVCPSGQVSQWSALRTFTMTCSIPFGQAEVVSPNAATLTWRFMSYNGVSLNYNLQWRVLGSNVWTTVQAISSSSYQLTSLVNGQVYEWQLQTICPDGSTTPYTQPRSFTTGCYAPGNLSDQNRTATSTQIIWQSLPGVTSSLRYRAVGSTSWNTVTGLTGNVYSLTGLTNATSYEVQVQSVCSTSQTSAFTVSYTFTTSCTPPSTGAGAVSTNSALLTWNNLGTGIRYNLVWRQTGAPTAFTVTSLTTSSYSLTGLTNATTYEFQLQTICTDGSVSGFSDSRSFTTGCNAPASFVSSLGATFINSFWTDFGPGVRYNLQWRPVGAAGWTLVSALTTAAYNLTGLSPLTTYEFIVQTICPDGSTSAYTTPRLVTTTSCQTPTNPTESSLQATSVRLNWGWYSSTSLRLQWRPVGAGTWNTVSGITAGFYNLTGLTASTAYEWQVQADCSPTLSSTLTAPRTFTTASCTSMYSVRTGNWNDPTTWSCNRVPISSDVVKVSIGHIVTIPSGVSAVALTLQEYGRLVYGTGSRLRLGTP